MSGLISDNARPTLLSSRAEESHLGALPELVPFVEADEGMVGGAALRRNPFGTMKAWMGATHFLIRTLTALATRLAQH
jgi:hypothetical protein